ncbi:1798_t:CDS:2 [Diversispora eburnea]|uniref:1798_t:CDS:1 n=1 Tax=Diversispora eburnea TaxID=1213867 RepID=A0A9N8VRY5_9GLOM|nr:1798_t:CDS:2 [Diversispora eburnea]
MSRSRESSKNDFDSTPGKRFELNLENSHDTEHVPVIKKVLDLRSYQTGIVGKITENLTNESAVTAPMPTIISNNGFPKPVHRNEDTRIFNSDYLDIDRENNEKIAKMSETEINETVEMLRKSLSPGFIEKLMKKKSLHVRFEEKVQSMDTEFDYIEDYSSLDKMKEKYFPDVPAEPQKMEWMGIKYNNESDRSNFESIGIPSESPTASLRFDFNGNIVDKNSNIPSYLGLHHHGKDPDQAGYTISELLHLTRSTVPSQKIIPLNILGRIVKKVRKGVYGKENNEGIAEYIMRMKLPVYLRSALDDSFESVIVAAIDAIAALTIGGSEGFNEEEEYWENLFKLYRGYEVVALKMNPDNPIETHFGMDISSNDFNEESLDTIEGHNKLASKDLVAGFISMDITHRFRYLLQVYELPPIANEQILLTLVYFARHSHKSAKIIYDCPRLLDIIHEKFISLPWPILRTENNSSTLKFPSLAAAKLIRTLCQTSKKISDEMITKYIDSFLRYIVINPASLSEKSEMIIGYEILKETLRIYHTLAAYGLYQTHNIQEPEAQPSDFIKDSIDFLARWISSFPINLTSKNITEEYVMTALNLISSITRFISSWCKYLKDNSLKDISEIQRLWKILNMEHWHSSNLCIFLQNQLTNFTNEVIQKNNIWKITNFSGADSSEVVKSSFSIEILQLYIIKNPVKANWFAFFDRTRIYLLYEWVNTFKFLIRNSSSLVLLKAEFISVCNILPGDESMALDIIKSILMICPKASDVLEPFYKHLIKIEKMKIPDKQETYSFSGSQNDKIDKTLMWDYSNDLTGLPLSRGWIWSPIDILFINKFKSGMDQERKVEIIYNCLIFAWDSIQICNDSMNPTFVKYIMDPAITIISIMKIFMLEGELYNVPENKILIEKILSQFTFSQLNINSILMDGVIEQKSLELVAKEVLKIPFYQFFSDFIGVYIAESAGNKSFVQLTIMPLSSLYPADFKLLVWSDLHNVLGTINIGYEDVLCINSTLNSYFWPIESNTAILQSFVNSILYNKVTRKKTPFLYWMVIHHLNGFVFWTKSKESDNSKNKDNTYKKRVEISKAIIKSAKEEIIIDWLKYTSKNFGKDLNNLIMFPECFVEINNLIIGERVNQLKFFGLDLREDIIDI